MKICTGQEVKWRSGIENSAHMFYGKVKRLLGDVAVVDDRSGLTRRCVAVSRLEPIVAPRQRFAGHSA